MISRGLIWVCCFMWICSYGQEGDQIEFDPIRSDGCQSCQHNQWMVPSERFKKGQLKKAFQYLGWDKEADFQLSRELKDEDGREFLYLQQHHLGIPVQGALVQIGLTSDVIEYIHGKYIPPIFLPDTQSILPPALATKLALEKLTYLHFAWENQNWEEELRNLKGEAQASYYPTAKLIYVPKNPRNTFFELAYQIKVRSIEPDDEYEIWISASTGDILKSKAMSSYCQPVSATFESLYYGSQSVNIRFRGWPNNDYILESCTPELFKTRIYETNSFGEGRSWSNLSKITFGSKKWGLHEQNATTAHWCLQKALDFFATEANWMGPSARGENIRLLVDWTQSNGQSQENARYLESKDIHYIYLGQIQGKSLATLDIVGHEIAHAYINEFADLGNERESGALSEGLADILGFLVEKHVMGPTGNWNWTIGEEVIPIRSLSDPFSFAMPVYAGEEDPFWYPTDASSCPEALAGYAPIGNDNCGIHQNSSVISHWFYLLTQGGEQNDVLVRPISVEDGAEIVLRTIKYYLLPTSSFADARNASLRAAEDLFGFCSHQVAQVKNAWAAAGVGEANTSECVTILGSTDLCLNEPERQYLFEAIGPIDAEFEWLGIPPSWSYRFQGERNQFLSIEDLPEEFESAEVLVLANWGGKTDTSVLRLDAVECGQKSPRQPDPLPNFDEIRLFPNPGQSKVKIFMPDGNYPAEIEIYDAQGRLLLRDMSNQSLYTFDVESWNRGIYMAKVKSSKAVWQNKFLVL